MDAFEPEISETAQLRAFVTVDCGTVRRTKIGERTMVMASVHVGHDVLIGDDCEIAPMTSIGGHVEIGNNVRVGQGALFKPFVKIGDGARIGMGAVVVCDVPAGETWAGNPAEPIRKPVMVGLSNDMRLPA